MARVSIPTNAGCSLRFSSAQAIDLWSDMLHTQLKHDKDVVSTIDTFHTKGLGLMGDMKETLMKLHSLYNRDIQRAAEMEKKRMEQVGCRCVGGVVTVGHGADLHAWQISELEVANHALLDENGNLSSQLDAARQREDALLKKIAELEARLRLCTCGGKPQVSMPHCLLLRPSWY
jgi:hypothetical protein